MPLVHPPIVSTLSFFWRNSFNVIGFLVVYMLYLECSLLLSCSFMDWTCVNGDLVLNNFLLVDKLISCFKTYIVGYDALHIKGSEVFGFVCLLGFFFHWFAIAYHLVRNQRTWIRTRVKFTEYILLTSYYINGGYY